MWREKIHQIIFDLWETGITRPVLRMRPLLSAEPPLSAQKEPYYRTSSILSCHAMSSSTAGKKTLATAQQPLTNPRFSGFDGCLPLFPGESGENDAGFVEGEHGQGHHDLGDYIRRGENGRQDKHNENGIFALGCQ